MANCCCLKYLNVVTVITSRMPKMCAIPQLVSAPGVVLAEKLGRGVRPASQSPYPIYDQNLRFSLPYL